MRSLAVRGLVTVVASVGFVAPAATAWGAPAAGASHPSLVRAATLDDDKLERVIKADLVKGVGKSVPVSVTCQSGVPIQKGRKSTCTARVGGQALRYNVTQTSNDGDVRYKRTKALLDLRKAERVIAKQVADQVGGKWTMTCRPIGSQRFYVIGVRKSFTCPIKGTNGSGDKQSGTIKVTVSDLAGNVDWKTI